MDKKLTGKALAKFEAERDVWQEVLEGVREIKAGGGRRTKVEPRSQVGRVRMDLDHRNTTFVDLGTLRQISGQPEADG